MDFVLLVFRGVMMTTTAAIGQMKTIVVSIRNGKSLNVQNIIIIAMILLMIHAFLTDGSVMEIGTVIMDLMNLIAQ